MKLNEDFKHELRMSGCMILSALLALFLLPFGEWVVFVAWFVLTLVFFFLTIAVEVFCEVWKEYRR